MFGAAPAQQRRRSEYGSFWNVAVFFCLVDSCNLLTTELTASPKRPEGEIWASIRKSLSYVLILLKFNHKCLSVATRAIDK